MEPFSYFLVEYMRERDLNLNFVKQEMMTALKELYGSVGGLMAVLDLLDRSPDGFVIVRVCKEDTTKFWNAMTLSQTFRVKKHSNNLNTLQM